MIVPITFRIILTSTAMESVAYYEHMLIQQTGRERRRHDITMWRNRHNDADTRMKDYEDRMRACHAEKKNLQERYNQMRAQAPQRR